MDQVSVWEYSAEFFLLLAAVLLFAHPAVAKIAIDFDPNLDFSKFKTFAFIGGRRTTATSANQLPG